ncbi:lysosomal acid lipase/cholesteryl ester hydrolase-like [Stylophora pistillata]|uniref:Lipase n=1 Tax=Stylophora pistillata TaxID=50429 RepID=A0A2B4RM83_STYPI|nr:lysosomal acid lipase/cholesteryl ester hydrolase-like [Stylophora pistillata]PFX17933.1 Lysosomal acid lipase/cholesteryl ester hydrolase [Stylophora pistillata]
MQLIEKTVFFFLASSLWTGISAVVPLPEENMNVTQMIIYNGYPAEEYDYTTPDGYIITIQRIPHGRHETYSSEDAKPVILVQHGLLDVSSTWVSNLPNESFGFILADKGFDVWLGNVRGNTYGRRHVNLSVDSDAFWNFSFDEMAKYELPTAVNFILNKTGQTTLYYAGHSQGSLMAFAELSRNQDLAKKIKAVFGLGPVAYLGHMKSPLKLLADYVPELEDLFVIFGVRDFLPSNDFIHWMATNVCEPPELRLICSSVIFLLCGFDVPQLNLTRLPVYVSHTPAGTSVKNLVHFNQLYKSSKFQMYDYGSPEKNKEHYGTATVPQYNASAITVPIALYYGGNDWLADPSDVKILMQKLTSKWYDKYIAAWQHLDFTWGLDAASVVYDDIIKRINEIEYGL